MEFRRFGEETPWSLTRAPRTQQSEAMSSAISNPIRPYAPTGAKRNDDDDELNKWIIRGDNIAFISLSQKQNFKMASSHRPLSFPFSQNSDLPMFLVFRAVGGIRRVQIPSDICTPFGRYLYSTKLSWIIKSHIIYNRYCTVLLVRLLLSY